MISKLQILVWLKLSGKQNQTLQYMKQHDGTGNRSLYCHEPSVPVPLTYGVFEKSILLSKLLPSANLRYPEFSRLPRRWFWKVTKFVILFQRPPDHFERTDLIPICTIGRVTSPWSPDLAATNYWSPILCWMNKHRMSRRVSNYMKTIN